MRTINVNVNAGTSALTFYVPAPCRGIVVGLKATFNQAVAAADTVTAYRSTSAVNAITTGATTAGIIYTGTRDSDYKELIFDPASSTTANTVIKITISALESANTLTNIEILFDDMALTTQ